MSDQDRDPGRTDERPAVGSDRPATPAEAGPSAADRAAAGPAAPDPTPPPAAAGTDEVAAAQPATTGAPEPVDTPPGEDVTQVVPAASANASSTPDAVPPGASGGERQWAEGAPPPEYASPQQAAADPSVPAGDATPAGWAQPAAAADRATGTPTDRTDQLAGQGTEAAGYASEPSGYATDTYGQPPAAAPQPALGSYGQQPAPGPYQPVAGQPAPGQPAPGQPGPGQPVPGQPGPGQPVGGPTDATGQFGATQQIPAYAPAGYGMPAWQQPGPYGPKPPSRARRWVAAGAAAVILVLAGGLVGGATVHALDGNTPMESTVVSSPVSVKGGSLADMVKQVRPSVVSLKVQAGDSGDEGSGVIISTNGMIVTNNHVVEAAADGNGSIQVTFDDGTTAPAKIVGRDPSGDLAVVQAQGKSHLKPAVIGNSDKLAPGDGVVAIGSPLGLEGTVTQGIVSALNRSYTVSTEQQPQRQNPFDFQDPQKQQQQQGSGAITIPNAIQTDAAINPGNSGGPLLNMSGQVIGINSAIRSSDSSGGGQGGSIGIGFAIPINVAKATADKLIKGEKVQHPLFGVSVATASDSNGNGSGALVAAVTKGGPADKAGLKKGDVITQVDDTKVASSDALVSVVAQHQPGDKVKVTYTRNGKTHTATATLAAAK
ncbi:trypsin-like peptidase domain-containing protein [Actinocatenispora sera]|uniref:PDZ domain-containing protein n=1 Tax=Actinocatenispora sera TaxID=390989 RepID=A0A810LA82_9ACTN|nr:trypsin-like peptidase domain-containing protein [Actinocatenispora sera]BCJ32474.1 hypothetical protein Asera_65820 [Actinocatenispora sera]